MHQSCCAIHTYTRTQYRMHQSCCAVHTYTWTQYRMHQSCCAIHTYTRTQYRTHQSCCAVHTYTWTQYRIHQSCCAVVQGWASSELHPGRTPPDPSMAPLLDAILQHVPPPPGDPSGQFAMLVTMTERDSFLGRVATGRIASGHIKVGDKIRTLRHNGEFKTPLVDLSWSVLISNLECGCEARANVFIACFAVWFADAALFADW